MIFSAAAGFDVLPTHHQYYNNYPMFTSSVMMAPRTTRGFQRKIPNARCVTSCKRRPADLVQYAFIVRLKSRLEEPSGKKKHIERLSHSRPFSIARLGRPYISDTLRMTVSKKKKMSFPHSRFDRQNAQSLLRSTPRPPRYVLGRKWFPSNHLRGLYAAAQVL